MLQKRPIFSTYIHRWIAISTYIHSSMCMHAHVYLYVYTYQRIQICIYTHIYINAGKKIHHARLELYIWHHSQMFFGVIFVFTFPICCVPLFLGRVVRHTDRWPAQSCIGVDYHILYRACISHVKYTHRNVQIIHTELCRVEYNYKYRNM